MGEFPKSRTFLYYSIYDKLRNARKINSSLNNCSFCFLNHDYTEEDEKDEFKVFLFILFIFFSVIMVQKQNEQIGTHMLNVYFLNQAF